MLRSGMQHAPMHSTDSQGRRMRHSRTNGSLQLQSFEKSIMFLFGPILARLCYSVRFSGLLRILHPVRFMNNMAHTVLRHKSIGTQVTYEAGASQSADQPAKTVR